jgi:protein-S-isoprenylcysteine O-methyltransferase Ste14
MTLESILLWLVKTVAILTFVGFMFFVFYPKFSSVGSVKKSFFKDRSVSLQFWIFTIFYVILLGQLFIFNENYTKLAIYIFGATVAISGLLISFVARFQMRAVWSPITNTNKSKEIMNTGIFGIMRHPVYLGRLLFFIGIMLMLNLKLLILAPLYRYFLRKKAIEEENYLVRANPKYKNYIKKVKRLF